MKNNKIARLIGGIDNEFVERAAPRTKAVRKRTAWIKWVMPAAACTAMFMFCMLAIPGLFNNPITSPNGDGQTVNAPGDSGHGSTLDSTLPEPSQNNTMYTLTLNKADSLMPSRILIPGHFWYSLTESQLEAVFPNLSDIFPGGVEATANYSGDGLLFDVAIHELSADGNIAVYNQFYGLTAIRIARGSIAEDVIYNNPEPVTSEVHGAIVTAGMFDYGQDDTAMYHASFMIGDIAYKISLHDSATGEHGINRLTELVNAIISNGAADLSVLDNPVIPELRNERLSLAEAHSDPDFGVYLPNNVPSRFNFESAQRFINQDYNSLSVLWTDGLNNFDWRVSKATSDDFKRIVSPAEHEKYDMSLYSIPLFDSVPEELREYVHGPVFRAEEITLEVVQARVLQGRQGRDGGQMYFSVLFDGIIININAIGVSPEQIWDMLGELKI
ncbi:MAG: hypothetical protein FWD90_08200 [Defluviitaleaceae bacterium]|nr:hypothetical protein [Defluviitaleaceae bacterium]